MIICPGPWPLLEQIKESKDRRNRDKIVNEVLNRLKGHAVVVGEDNAIRQSDFDGPSVNGVLSQGAEIGLEPSKLMDCGIWNSLPKDVRKILSEQGYYCAGETEPSKGMRFD